jgi:hypothetical protein
MYYFLRAQVFTIASERRFYFRGTKESFSNILEDMIFDDYRDEGLE